MSCTNCFSGCVSTTSDKCVKYTGSSIDFLNIHTGDSLEAVEEAITTYLSTVLTGLGISPVIAPADICTIVSNHLSASPTLVDVLTAVVKSICDIEVEILAEHARIDVIEANYTVDCLTSATDAGTHAILQEVITTLCTAVGDITTLENLYATCVTTGSTNNITTLIQNYLSSITSVNYWYTKMVPYVIYPFRPTSEILASFNSSGAGLTGTIWEKIYFCNGQNTTPDLRGRSLIGVVSAMGASDYDDEINPANEGCTDYAVDDKNGTNVESLSIAQLASHTHVASVAITDPGHSTSITYRQSIDVVGTDLGTNVQPIGSINDQPTGCVGAILTGDTSTVKDETGLDGTNVVVTNATSGSGGYHPNVHPVYACYYITYLP